MISLVSKILKNKNFLSLASNMAVAVFGFLSFIILVRSLEKSLFGEWVIYITAGNFIEMLRFGITRTAIIRFLSGAKLEERARLIGSNWLIGLVATALLAILIWVVYFIFPNSITDSGYSLFFIWYPILSFINLPFNNALSVLHADQKFDKILYVRLINTGLFVLFLIINLFSLHWGLMEILYAHLIVNAITSIYTMLFKWDGIQYLLKASRAANKTILDFGKYTTGTLIGANLLKSSDTFLIALSPFLGATGVAIYSVPLKLTEILEIPLRSFVATAFPRMSKASIEGKIDEVKNIYYTYTGGLTYLLLPVIIICFIFAEEFVYILGGPEYVETANIFRIFCVYGLFVPIDKFTGVALDSINKPKRNFFKVLYMALANIVGDIIAIFIFSSFFIYFSISSLLIFTDHSITTIGLTTNTFATIATLEMVALVTILFTLLGIAIGLNYLDQEIGIKKRNIFTKGLGFISTFFNEFLRFGKKVNK